MSTTVTTTTTITRAPSTSPAEVAVAPLVTAFAADPVIRWMLPDPARYVIWFPELVAVVGARGFSEGTVDTTADAAASSVWLAPGASFDEVAFGTLIERCVDAHRLDDVGAFLARMGEHHPEEPVWHLYFIGVDPNQQGRSIGSALLEHGLARADADGHAAYLEASTPRNRALYERHGFEVVGEIRAADSPAMWPMFRPAR
jgi:ribosomal protein S18 acetylase RimI-like enzyme